MFRVHMRAGLEAEVSGLVGSDGVWASVINGRDEDTQGPVEHSCCLVLSTDVRTVLDSLEVLMGHV